MIRQACKPCTGILDSLTLEMVPFFPSKNALHPCTLIVCVYHWQMRCNLLHHSCMQWQAAVKFKNNIRNLERIVFNDDLSLRVFATSLAVFLPSNFCGPGSVVCTFLVHLSGLKTAPKYGLQNCAPNIKFSFTVPILGTIFGSAFGSAKSKKKASRNPHEVGCVSEYDAT